MNLPRTFQGLETPHVMPVSCSSPVLLVVEPAAAWSAWTVTWRREVPGRLGRRRSEHPGVWRHPGGQPHKLRVHPVTQGASRSPACGQFSMCQGGRMTLIGAEFYVEVDGISASHDVLGRSLRVVRAGEGC